MHQLTLELKNEIDLNLILTLANSLDAKVLDIENTPLITSQNPVDWLEKIAKNGGIKSISNPTDWQREIRKDKVLYQRD
jgi:hypothetical protein